MSSEQPKLNNSEANNSTSGESQTAPQKTVMASQPAPATHTPKLMTPMNPASAATLISDNFSISSNKNRRPSKKAKSFAAPSLA